MEMEKICKILQEHDRYCILTHRRPDGDTIGSAVALCLGLRKIGKQAFIFDNPQFTDRFLPYLKGLVSKLVPDDATIVSVDIASDGLICFGAEEIKSRNLIAIDHHESHTVNALHHLVQADSAACGEIIFELLQRMNIEIDCAIADALYIAISTDTGCFKYSNTTARTLRIAANLLECGAHADVINKIFFDTKSYARLQLEAWLTNSVEFYAGGIVGLCMIPKKLLIELNLTEDDIDSISGFARAIDGVKIGIMIREIEGGAGKISLRTSPEYNASSFCEKLGGGGHAAAAGCTVAGGIEQAKNAIIELLKQSGILI